MYKITANDLKRRTTAELSSMFNHIHLGVGWLSNPSPERTAALALLSMIRTEQTRRAVALQWKAF